MSRRGACVRAPSYVISEVQQHLTARNADEPTGGGYLLIYCIVESGVIILVECQDARHNLLHTACTHTPTPTQVYAMQTEWYSEDSRLGWGAHGVAVVVWRQDSFNLVGMSFFIFPFFLSSYLKITSRFLLGCHRWPPSSCLPRALTSRAWRHS